MDSPLETISIIKKEKTIQNNSDIESNNNHSKSNKKKEEEINLEKRLELSKIENIENKMKTKDKNGDINISLNISDISIIKDKSTTENNNNNKHKPKITKEELNNIPLPIFSCIYCCNEEISFKHLSNEIISNKYLFQTSIYDLKQLDILISKNDQKQIDNKLYNLYLDNLENLKSFYYKDKILSFFKSKKFLLKCANNEINISKRFRMKIEEKANKKKKDFYFKEIKEIQRISKNSLNNKCLFNSNSLINNYSYLIGLIHNGTSVLQNLPEKKINSLSNSHSSNLLHSNSMIWNKNEKKNEIGMIGQDKNGNYVENIVEKIDKNVESDIFDFLGENYLKRKINRKDIEWEDTFYDVNNPIIDDEIIEDQDIYNFIDNKKIKNKNKINNIIKENNTTEKSHKSNKVNITCNSSKYISANSDNKSNIKISIFNTSKSLASTNTSSNIILKNSVRDRENKASSLFLNGNKILNINNMNNNNSTLSPRFNNIIIKNLRKSKKLINEKGLLPSLTKNKMTEINSKSYKKIFCNGSSCLDLKNSHKKKILFNYTININKDITESSNIKIPNVIDIKSIKNKFLNHIKNNAKSENKKSNNKYNILLTKNFKINNNNNDDMNYNRSLFEKMIKRLKSGKDNHKINGTFNSVFKFKNGFEQNITNSEKNNIKYSLLFSNTKKRYKNLSIKSLDSDYLNNYKKLKIIHKANNNFE